MIASVVVCLGGERAARDCRERGSAAGDAPSFELCLEAVGDSVVVSYGGRALALYVRGDQGMRNLAIGNVTRSV
jgi:hypothetical protein